MRQKSAGIEPYNVNREIMIAAFQISRKDCLNVETDLDENIFDPVLVKIFNCQQ